MSHGSKWREYFRIFERIKVCRCIAAHRPVRYEAAVGMASSANIMPFCIPRASSGSSETSLRTGVARQQGYCNIIEKRSARSALQLRKDTYMCS